MDTPPKDSKVPYRLAQSTLTEKMLTEVLDDPKLALAELVEADRIRTGVASVNPDEIAFISRKTVSALALNHFRMNRKEAARDSLMIIESATDNLRNAGLGYDLPGYVSALEVAASNLIHKIDPSLETVTTHDKSSMHGSRLSHADVIHTLASAKARIHTSPAGSGFGRARGGPLTPEERAKLTNPRDEGWER